MLCAFDMHRDALMTNRERREHLEGKVDCLIEYPFTEDVRGMDAEAFVDQILYRKLHAAHIVVGTDFTFGHGKKGTPELLKSCPENMDSLWM